MADRPCTLRGRTPVPSPQGDGAETTGAVVSRSTPSFRLGSVPFFLSLHPPAFSVYKARCDLRQLFLQIDESPGIAAIETRIGQRGLRFRFLLLETIDRSFRLG